MKRSEINNLVRSATKCFESNGWVLPPNPKWDVTDFGLGDWKEHGLVLVNLADEPEYCEKLMYGQEGMVTPSHTHLKKKEDIISRFGTFRIQLWCDDPSEADERPVHVKINGEPKVFSSGETVDVSAGSRITLVPGVYHAFWPISTECIIGEVSTANDDVNDNIFANHNIGRYPELIEDEPALVKLLSDKD